MPTSRLFIRARFVTRHSFDPPAAIMELKCTEKHTRQPHQCSERFCVGFFVLRRVYTRSYLPLLPPERGREQRGGHAVHNKRPNQFLLIPVLFQRVEVVVGGGRLALTNPPLSPHPKGETCQVPQQLSCILSLWRCGAAIEAASCVRNGDRACKQIAVGPLIRRGLWILTGGGANR